ncbi:hypothetical protein KUTeg_002706 [Tegillarca granosa]|uniref:Protein RCC2 n=1 Tax=Tegillarca granosa TaxID=220873 RepID=A0ABQ9FV67_TEGGR|nr:hypothetical protein KUTeg_002706 [Tegillarca granosa]
MPPVKKRTADGDGKPVIKRKKKKDGDSDDDFEDDAGGDVANNGSESVGQYDVTLEGSMLTGELLFCGGSNWDLVGRKQVPKGVKNGGGPNLWSPHRICNMLGVKVRTVRSGCSACHSVAITADGKAMTWGRNDLGQLGLGDTKRRDLPTEVPLLEGLNIIDAAVGRNHTLFLTGIKHICYKGPPIRTLAAGAEFSMIGDIRGNLYSFGLPEYGQLGSNRSIVVAADESLVSWGVSPTYGELGYGDSKPKSSSTPQEVKTTEGSYIQSVSCGFGHTLLIARTDSDEDKERVGKFPVFTP